MQRRKLLDFLLDSRRALYRTLFFTHHTSLLDRYLHGDHVKKLQLGSGFNRLTGWLNTDLNPHKDILFLDVTQPFSLPSNVFDYVFSEHIIEHIPFPGAQTMLAEAFRVLKPGGKVRIVTPDLAFLIQLYHSHKSEVQQEYMRWSQETYFPELHVPFEALDTFVINNFVRNWGHTFIYDEKALKFVFEQVGFVKVTRKKPLESDDHHLKNIESHPKAIEATFQRESLVKGSWAEKFNYLESLVLEGTKP